ncbi:MAG: bifunctional methylenetetrahydrofolate dehydrogenase/methenyltetrahydrofolate cyclohydrolase FolD [Dehalococcoidia bacterium]
MTAQVISGTQVAAEIRQEIAQQVKELKASKGVIPGLAVVLVGEDPASISYVTAKAKGSEEVGVHEETIRLPADISESDLLEKLAELNQDPRFHGILVQMPLPKHLDEKQIINNIAPEKDVDAFHPVNVGKLLIGEPDFLPCTPHGIMQLLTRSGNDPGGKHMVIVGRSNIVGKPLMAMMIQKAKGANATVTVVHTGTVDMAHYVREADIVIAAAGKAHVVTADMVKDGAVVIDVGVNRIPDASTKTGYRLVGDVDFEAVKEKAKAITPVPGGVGPMTVTMLLLNTVRAAEKAAGA